MKAAHRDREEVRETEISTESYIHSGERWIPTAKLTPAERKDLAQWMKMTYLNELYRGQAVVTAETGGEG